MPRQCGAEVSGLRGTTSPADCAAWDNYHIENWLLDFTIMLVTLAAVVRFAEAE
jgi:hypothetical protein